MNLHIIKDQDAQSDFGYRKIEHYEILVKESVFKQMLRAELKNPRNWFVMIYQLARLFLSLFSQIIMASAVLTFLVGLFLAGNVESTAGILNGAWISEHAKELFSFFIMMVVLTTIIKLCLMGWKTVRNAAPNNAFTQQVWQKLQYQAMHLEAERRNEMA